VLQCVAVCCSVRCRSPFASSLQESTLCVAVCCGCSMLCVLNCCSGRCMSFSTLELGDHMYVLQCAAVCCSVLQCAAVCCSVLQCKVQERIKKLMGRPYVCAAVCCRGLQCAAVCCSISCRGASTSPLEVLLCMCCRVFKSVAVCCSVLQCKVQELIYTSMRRPYVCVAVRYRVLLCAAECRSVLQCVTV